ncbi:MAG: hypothetical protein ISR65_17475 [Bacteriovoracaceae bacterium]|nr:hypothetical protein [Bacteriovoracaceae bacterium]
MKKTNSILTVFVLFTAIYSTMSLAKLKYEGTMDYIEKTKRLWGIASVVHNKDDTITIIDAKNSGYGYGLSLRDTKYKFASTVTLSSGESCSLLDDHGTITYKFLGLSKGNVIIEVTDYSDARSFGGGITEKVKKIKIQPY